MKRLPHAGVVLGTVLIIGVYIVIAYKVGQVPDIPELITCEERYMDDTYWGEVKYRDGDYIYLDGYHSLETICTPYKEMVDEETPLCGTQVAFEGPLDTSNMNCYASEDDFKGKLKAFKKQTEDEKKENEKYYTCNLNTMKMVELYNSCKEVECARYRMSEYLKEVCPRANLN